MRVITGAARGRRLITVEGLDVITGIAQSTIPILITAWKANMAKAPMQI